MQNGPYRAAIWAVSSYDMGRFALRNGPYYILLYISALRMHRYTLPLSLQSVCPDVAVRRAYLFSTFLVVPSALFMI